MKKTNKRVDNDVDRRIQLVQIEIDPKTSNLDKAIRNILLITNTVDRTMPDAQISEIAIDNTCAKASVALSPLYPAVCFCMSDSLH